MMDGSRGWSRLRYHGLAFVALAALSSMLHAQATNPTTRLESPQIGQPATTMLEVPTSVPDVYRDSGIDDVVLCLPSCRAASSRTGSGLLRDGENLWNLNAGACVETNQSTCRVDVTYTAGVARESSAELEVSYYQQTIVGKRDSDSESLGTNHVVYYSLKGGVDRTPGIVEIVEDQLEIVEGSAVEVMVYRVNGADGELRATWSINSSNRDYPVSPDDYRVTTPSSRTLVWPDGDSNPIAINIEALEDTLDEETESAFLVVSWRDEFEEVRSTGSELFIENVPFVPGYAVFDPGDAYSVSEGDTLDILVRRVEGSDGALSAELSEGGGFDYDATVNTDYEIVEPDDGTLFWADGDDSTRTVKLVAKTDTDPEETESLVLYMESQDESYDDGCCGGYQDTAEVRILDVPPPIVASVIQFESAEHTVAENSGPLSLTVTRGGGIDRVAVVEYRLTDATATLGEDYGSREQSRNGRLVWDNNDPRPQTIDIPIADDDIPGEGTETFTVELSVPLRTDGSDQLDPAVILGDNNVATVRIEDTTTLPDTITVAQSSYEVDEGAGSLDVQVRRIGTGSGPASIGYRLVPGTAEAGDDFLVEAQSGRLDWPAGESDDQAVRIGIVDDENFETDEIFTLVLEEPRNATLGQPQVAEIKIGDNDPRGVLEFASTLYAVEESEGSVTLTVSRSEGMAGPATVMWAASDNEALAGTDYATAPGAVRGGVLQWDAGEAGPMEIVLDIAADEVAEPEESFNIVLSDASGAALGEANSATVLIGDSTIIERDRVQFAVAGVTISEGDENVELVVRRVGDDGRRASVRYTVTAGTAIPGSDFTPATGGAVLQWAEDDDGDKVINVPIVNDEQTELDESFTVTLLEPNGVVIGSPASAEVTIIDDEEPGVLVFDPTRYTVPESEGTVVLTVKRTEGAAGPATVTWEASSMTAIAREDFAAAANAVLSGELSWPAGNADEQTISLDIASDDVTEPEESFEVTLSQPTGAELGVADRATVSIQDVTVVLDEIEFVEDSSRIDESGGSVRIALQRTGNGDGPASVAYAVTAGTASPTTDLRSDASLEGVVAWESGETGERILELPIQDDTIVEGDETFTVTLSDPEDSQLGSQVTHEVTIVDIEVSTPASGTLRFVDMEATLDAGESDGEVQLAIERIGGSAGAVSVRYATIDSTAIAGSDYQAASGTLNWDDGEDGTRLITIVIERDTNVEDDEQFLVRLSDAVGLDAELPTDALEIAVTITDTTRVGNLVVSGNGSVSIDEFAGDVVLNVLRRDGSDGAVGVRYETIAGTATENSGTTPGDYSPVDGVLRWQDGEVGERELRIPIIDDTQREQAETFLVRFYDTPPIGTGLLDGGEVTVVIRGSDLIDSGETDPVAELGMLRLVVTSGGEQAGLPGDILEPMSAQVVDGASDDSLMPGTSVTWRANPAGSAELLDGIRTVSDQSGRVSNRVRIVSRGFLNIVASIEVAGSDDSAGSNAASSPSTARQGEAVFVVRSGLAAADELTPNQAETGGALDAACEGLDAQIEGDEEISDGQRDLLGTCRELETRLGDGRLPTALDRLAHEELLSIGDSIISTTDIQVTNVYARINSLRSRRKVALDLAGLGFDIFGERIPGNVVEAAKNAWAGGGGASADGEGFGSRLGTFANGLVSVGEVDGDGNQANADIRTGGVTIGVDYRITPNLVAGAGIGIVDNLTEFTSDDGSADMRGLSLLLFSTYYEPDSGYLDGVLEIGRNRYDVRRRINLPGLPHQFGVGETDADVFSLTFGAGKDFNIGPYEFGPYSRVSLVRADVDGYSERSSGSGTGSGSVLTIESHEIGSTRIAVGAQISRSIGTRRGVFVPQLRLEMEIENEDDTIAIEARFQNDPTQSAFTVNGNPHDSAYLNIGIGGSAVFVNGLSGHLFYESRLQHDYITQDWLKGGFRLEF